MNNTAFAHSDHPFDVDAARREFPILARMVHGKPLAYLDNGASAQRPQCVIDAVDDYERHHHANIHRGVHTLSQEATALYEGARDRIVRFINARSRSEIIFVRGTTEAINLVAQSYARPTLQAGRRGADHAPGAPREHRALADGLRTDGRNAGRGADGCARRGPSGCGGIPDEPAHQDLRLRSCIERLGHRSARASA